MCLKGFVILFTDLVSSVFTICQMLYYELSLQPIRILFNLFKRINYIYYIYTFTSDAPCWSRKVK